MKTLRLLLILVFIGAALLACATRNPRNDVTADSAVKTNGLSEESKIRTAAVYYVIEKDLELSPDVEVFVSLNAAERALLASKLPRHVIRPIQTPTQREKGHQKVPNGAVELTLYNVSVTNQVARVTVLGGDVIMYDIWLQKNLEWSVRESRTGIFDYTVDGCHSSALTFTTKLVSE